MPTVNASFATSRKDGESVPFHCSAVPEEAEAKEAERTGAISVVRHAAIQLSGIRDQPRGADRCGGGVLPTTSGGGESDQRSQPGGGLGGASLGAMGPELGALPIGDAGLQPELLADAVQPGGATQ